jgi:hypothetical protein
MGEFRPLLADEETGEDAVVAEEEEGKDCLG